MPLSDLERRYRERLQAAWSRAEDEPTVKVESPLDREKERSVVLRFKAEERLRLIEQRAEEAGRARGRRRGLSEARREVDELMESAEGLLEELVDARAELERRARREAVELAIHMTRSLLELLPDALPLAVAPSLARFVTEETDEVGEGAVLRCHPDRVKLLSGLPAVKDGRVRLVADEASPRGRLRLVGSAGISELDPARGLERMATVLAETFGGSEAGE